ncbi:MAG: endonuclease/exonuclease/phosphatase family protein [Bdellovibrio sp.]|nr:endonuclease/exonuclease/phosphatase family protein [Bdellovibrio sp.]
MTRAVLLSFVLCYFLQFTLQTAQAQIPVYRKLELMGQGQNRPLLDSQKINILVWNIHKSEDVQWFTDIKNLISNRDFVLFQEAVYPQEIVDFFKELGPFEWAMASSFRLINKDFSRTGVTTAAKFKSANQDVLTTIYTEPIVGTPKVSLYTTYPTNKRGKKSATTLLVANIHAINFVSDLTFFLELLRIEKRLIAHKGPIILGGDFNTWSSTRLNLLNKLAKRQNLTAVPFSDSERRITLGHPLDHVFYRELTLLKKEDLSYITSSDHIPLSVQFQLN